MLNPNNIIPVDLEAAIGATDALWRMQQYLRLYGELICAWPALFEAAKHVAFSRNHLDFAAGVRTEPSPKRLQ